MQDAVEQGRHNIAFLGQLLLGRPSECVDLLVASGRIPEAAFFTRTYLPSRMSEVRQLLPLVRLNLTVLVCPNLCLFRIRLSLSGHEAGNSGEKQAHMIA